MYQSIPCVIENDRTKLFINDIKKGMKEHLNFNVSEIEKVDIIFKKNNDRVHLTCLSVKE